VIIPVKEIGEFVRESLRHLAQQTLHDVEVLVLPDRAADEHGLPQGTRVIPTWPRNGPADKRDLGARLANGEFLAFLDDDAYPSRDWLARAVSLFDGDPRLAGVGGPGVTPPEDSSRQRASGWVAASLLGGGKFGYRFTPQRPRYVDDFPSMNLIIRKSDFLAVGGFDIHLWPGEDTALCLKLTKALGKRIAYDPQVLVYHHRRPLFLPHLRQHARYGIRRGSFARALPATSLRPTYFAPSLFTAWAVVGAVLAWRSTPWRAVYATTMTGYVLALGVTMGWVWTKERDLKVTALTGAGIFSTHLIYGVAFIRGLLTPRHRGRPDLAKGTAQ
jgi:glycosyltransferase involved in cell wall biosynthesis